MEENFVVIYFGIRFGAPNVSLTPLIKLNWVALFFTTDKTIFDWRFRILKFANLVLVVLKFEVCYKTYNWFNESETKSVSE